MPCILEHATRRVGSRRHMPKCSWQTIRGSVVRACLPVHLLHCIHTSTRLHLTYLPRAESPRHPIPCGQMLSACTKLESDKAVDLWFGISVPLDQCYQYPSHWDTVLLDLHSACPATDDLEFRNLSPVAFHRRRQRVHHRRRLSETLSPVLRLSPTEPT